VQVYVLGQKVDVKVLGHRVFLSFASRDLNASLLNSLLLSSYWNVFRALQHRCSLQPKAVSPLSHSGSSDGLQDSKLLWNG